MVDFQNRIVLLGVKTPRPYCDYITYFDTLFKTFHYREFGTKCSKCLRTIQPTDWVRRAKDNVYHLACFACDNCKRQLSTGEEFALQDNKLLCKTHYVEVIEGGPSSGNYLFFKFILFLIAARIVLR